MPADRHRTSPEPAGKLPPQRSPARSSAHPPSSARAGAFPTAATVHRRQLLLGLGVGALALGTGLSLQDPDTVPGRPIPAGDGTNPGAAQPAGAFAPSTPPPPITRVPAPRGVITALPGTGNLLALTVDDGTSSDVVAAYTKFCTDTGVRLTFFVNGANRSWTDNAPALRPLVESGQVLLANHTWSHPDITTLSRTALREEITRNDTFLRSTYGITGLPFFRPPYGHHTPPPTKSPPTWATPPPPCGKAASPTPPSSPKTSCSASPGNGCSPNTSSSATPTTPPSPTPTPNYWTPSPNDGCGPSPSPTSSTGSPGTRPPHHHTRRPHPPPHAPEQGPPRKPGRRDHRPRRAGGHPQRPPHLHLHLHLHRRRSSRLASGLEPPGHGKGAGRVAHGEFSCSDRSWVASLTIRPALTPCRTPRTHPQPRLQVETSPSPKRPG